MDRNLGDMVNRLESVDSMERNRRSGRPHSNRFFVVPLIILAPWLITASVLAAKWGRCGFQALSLLHWERGADTDLR
jgi:hypothetical protein